ncbi:TonB-dependent receptor plug domain-containing protein [Sphingomonas ginkgonis]|nr:TonB-dependent receptor [Sphingomonas ginkgonis]
MFADLPPAPPATAIVVTASRTPEPQSDSAASATVLDADTIQRLGEPLADSLLRLTPSASLATSGSAGSQAQLRIRGAEANHTLLFIDGIRANDPAAGNEPRFELLSTDLASRIEVVRGPQSALWGSEAIGGVVAVDSDRKAVTAATVEAGSFGFARVSAGTGFAQGPLSVALGGGYQRATGIDSFGGPGGDKDGYWNASFRGRAALTLGGGNEAGLSGFAIRARSDFDGYNPVTFLHADTLDNSHNRLSAGRAWLSHQDQDWSASLSASLLGSTNRNDLGDTYLNRTDARRATYAAQVSRRFATGSVKQQLTAAVEQENERYTASDAVYGGFTDQRRTRRHRSVTGEWRADWTGRLVTDLALRRDAFNRFHDATSLRASALLKLSEALALTASYSEGIAQPTFTDLYGFFPGSFVGNPNILPERSRGGEVSLRWKRRAWDASATLYRQHLKDEIVTRFDGATFLSTTANATGRSRREGAELTLGWSPSSALRLSANYAWLHATQQVEPTDTATREERRPRHSGAVLLDGATGKFSYGASLAYVGVRFDTDFDVSPAQRVRLHGYALVGARAAYALNSRLNAFVRVANAFDARYQDVVGYRTEGRSIDAGIRLALDR